MAKPTISDAEFDKLWGDSTPAKPVDDAEFDRMWAATPATEPERSPNTPRTLTTTGMTMAGIKAQDTARSVTGQIPGTTKEEALEAARRAGETARVIGPEADAEEVRETLASTDPLDRALGRRVVSAPMVEPANRDAEYREMVDTVDLQRAFAGETPEPVSLGENQRVWMDRGKALATRQLAGMATAGLAPIVDYARRAMGEESWFAGAPETPSELGDLLTDYGSDRGVQRLAGMATTMLEPSMLPTAWRAAGGETIEGGGKDLARSAIGIVSKTPLPAVASAIRESTGMDEGQTALMWDDANPREAFDRAAEGFYAGEGRDAIDIMPYRDLPARLRGADIDVERFKRAAESDDSLASIRGLNSDASIEAAIMQLPTSVVNQYAPGALPTDDEISDTVKRRHRAKDWSGADLWADLEPLMAAGLMRPIDNGKDAMYVPSRFQEVFRYLGVPWAAVVVEPDVHPFQLMAPGWSPDPVEQGDTSLLAKARALRVPTVRGSETMIASGAYNDWLETFGLRGGESYADLVRPESTWYSRTLADFAMPDYGMRGWADVGERAGMDPNSAAAKTLGTADVLSQFVLPAEALVTAPLGAALRGGAVARSSRRALMELGVPARESTKVALKTFVSSDPLAMVGQSIKDELETQMRSGRFNPDDVTPTARRQLKDVLQTAGVDDADATTDRLLEDLRDRRARVLDVNGEMNVLGGPQTRALRESTAYRDVRRDMELLTSGGKTRMSPADVDANMRYQEAMALNAWDNKEVATPEEWFERQMWQVGVEAETLPAGTLFQKDPPAPKIKLSSRQALEQLQKQGTISDRQVAQILGDGRPEYLDAVMSFILEQRQKVLDGRLTNRDVAKAYVTSVASQRAGEINPVGLTEGWRRVTPEDGGPPVKIPIGNQIDLDAAGRMAGERRAAAGGSADPVRFTDTNTRGGTTVRPEETMAAWFFTDDGQRALDAIERGEFDAEAWERGALLRDAFGANTLRNEQSAGVFAVPEGDEITLRNISDLTKAINDAHGDPTKIAQAVGRLKGIGEAKTPFVSQLLGFGEAPTVDAIEINGWLTGKSAATTPESRALVDGIKRNYGGGTPGGQSAAAQITRTLRDRIAGGFSALQDAGHAGTADIAPEAFGAIMHHWFWDKLKQAETTHEGLYAAQRYASEVDGVLRGSISPSQTGSPEFAAFFEESKVVDPNGEPLMVYHGTDSDFTEFRDGPTYFSPDRKSPYLRQANAVVPAYVSLKNPLYTSDTRLVMDLRTKPDVVQDLKNQGYDGIVYADPADLTKPSKSGNAPEIVSFYPSQVKSAVGNVGTFDPANPNILYSVEDGQVAGSISRAIDKNIPSEVREAAGTGKFYTVNGRGTWSDIAYNTEEEAIAAVREASGLEDVLVKRANPQRLVMAVPNPPPNTAFGVADATYQSSLGRLRSSVPAAELDAVAGEGAMDRLGSALRYAKNTENQIPITSEALQNAAIIARKQAESSSAREAWLAFARDMEQAEGAFSARTAPAPVAVEVAPPPVVDRPGLRLVEDDDVLYSVENGQVAGSIQRAPTVNPQGFYSGLRRAVADMKGEKFSADQLRATLKNTPGVKAAEIEWTGLDSFLADNPKPTKAEVLDWLDENAVVVEERLLKGDSSSRYTDNPYNGQHAVIDLENDGEAIEFFPDEAAARERAEELNGRKGVVGPTRYESYQLPGGKNYREVLFRLPDDGVPEGWTVTQNGNQWEVRSETGQRWGANANRDTALRQAKKMLEEPAQYQAPHYGEEGKNLLAHTRLSDRTGPNGERLLHVEEVQSDLHQEGRDKGYSDPEATRKMNEQREAILRERDQYTADRNAEIERRTDLIPDGEYKSRRSARDAINLQLVDDPDWAPKAKRNAELRAELDGLDVRLAEANAAVPDAPFAKTWHELVMKRILRMAAEGGYDGVTWTTGAQQVKRYEDATRQAVDEILYVRGSNEVTQRVKAAKAATEDAQAAYDAVAANAGSGASVDGLTAAAERLGTAKDELSAAQKIANTTPGEGQIEIVGMKNGRETYRETMAPDKVADVLGKGMAAKIVNDPAPSGTLAGADLTIGGEGMKGFYDSMLRSWADKYGKKWGAKSGTTTIQTEAIANEAEWMSRRDSVAFEMFDHPTWDELEPFERDAVDSNLNIKKGPTATPVHYLPIPDNMRQSIMNEGQPLFSRTNGVTRGAISPDGTRGTGPVPNPARAEWIAKGQAAADRVAELERAAPAEIPNPEWAKWDAARTSAPDELTTLQQRKGALQQNPRPDDPEWATELEDVNDRIVELSKTATQAEGVPAALIAAGPSTTAVQKYGGIGYNRASILVDEVKAGRMTWEQALTTARREGPFASPTRAATAPEPARTIPAPPSPELVAARAELEALRGQRVPRTVPGPGLTKWLIRLFQTGDFSTALHEGGHLMALMRPAWEAKAAKVFDSVGGRLTIVGHEALAEAMARIGRGVFRPGRIKDRLAMDVLDVIGDLWGRVRDLPIVEKLPDRLLRAADRLPKPITLEQRKLLDNTFRPSERSLPAAVKIVDERQGRPLPPRVTVTGTTEGDINAGPVQRAGKARYATDVDRNAAELRQALGLKAGEQEVDPITLLAEAMAYIGTERVRRQWGVGGLMTLPSGRTAVPKERHEGVLAEAERHRRATLGFTPGPELVFNADQQAGLRRLLGEINDSPLGEFLPERLRDVTSTGSDGITLYRGVKGKYAPTEVLTDAELTRLREITANPNAHPPGSPEYAAMKDDFNRLVAKQRASNNDFWTDDLAVARHYAGSDGEVASVTVSPAEAADAAVYSHGTLPGPNPYAANFQLPREVSDRAAVVTDSLATLTHDEWKAVVGAHTDLYAGRGAFREKRAELASQSGAIRLLDNVVESARRTDLKPTIDAAMRAFNSTMVADETLQPAQREMLKVMVRDLAGTDAEVRRAVLAIGRDLRQGKKDFRAPDLIAKAAQAIPPEVVPVSALDDLAALEGLLVNPSLNKTAPLVDDIHKFFVEAPLWATANEQSARELEALGILARADLDDPRTADAMAIVHEGLRRRQESVISTGRDIAIHFAGTDEATIASSIPNVAERNRMYRKQYRSWYEGRWDENLKDIGDQGRAVAGQKYDQGDAALGVLLRLAVRRKLGEFARRMAESGIAGDVMDVAKGGAAYNQPYTIGGYANRSSPLVQQHIDNVAGYISAESGWQTTGRLEEGGTPYGAAPVNRVGLDMYGANFDPIAYAEARRQMSRWGFEPGQNTAAWSQIDLPGGGKIIAPDVFMENLRAAMDEVAPTDMGYRARLSGDPRLGEITKGASLVNKPGPGTEAVNFAIRSLSRTAGFSFGMLKKGMLTGIGPLIRPAYYIGNIFGGFNALHQRLGVRGMLRVGTAPLRTGPDGKLIRSVIKRLYQDVAGNPGPSVGFFTRDGRYITDTMVADSVTRRGISSSLASSEFKSSLVADIKAEEPTTWNNINRKMIPGTKAWAKMMDDGATAVDNYFRIGTYVDGLKRGISEEEAARLAREVAFDYNDLTEFERKVARKAILFYTFQRRNQDLFWRTLLNNPERLAAEIRLLSGMQRENLGEDSELYVSPFDEGRMVAMFREPLEDGHLENAQRGAMTLLPAMNVGSQVGLWVDLLGALSSAVTDAEYDAPSVSGLFGVLDPRIQTAIAMAGTDPETGRPLADTRKKIPDNIVAADQMISGMFADMDDEISGGMLVRDIFGARRVQPWDDIEAAIPGANVWEVDRTNPGAVRAWYAFQNLVALTPMANTAQQIDRFVPGGLADPRVGVTEAEEFAGWLGARTTPVQRREVVLGRDIRAREAELTRQEKEMAAGSVVSGRGR
jgi:hypothetical protein